MAATAASSSRATDERVALLSINVVAIAENIYKAEGFKDLGLDPQDMLHTETGDEQHGQGSYRRSPYPVLLYIEISSTIVPFGTHIRAGKRILLLFDRGRRDRGWSWCKQAVVGLTVSPNQGA